MVRPNLLLSIRSNCRMFRVPFIHSYNVEDTKEGFYFHVVLLIKAHSYVFQCNIIEKKL